MRMVLSFPALDRELDECPVPACLDGSLIASKIDRDAYFIAKVRVDLVLSDRLHVLMHGRWQERLAILHRLDVFPR